MARNAWETDQPFTQVSAVAQRAVVVLRVFPKSGSAPIVLELSASEALGLSIDLANRARVVIESEAR